MTSTRTRARAFAPPLLVMAATLALAGCGADDEVSTLSNPGGAAEDPDMTAFQDLPAEVLVAKLGAAQASDEVPGLAALQQSFGARNPGYSLEFEPAVRALPVEDVTRIVFVQRGERDDQYNPDAGLAVGDIVVLRPGESLETELDFAAVVFRVPDVPGESIPRDIRPDWDPGITDVPGGCATEEGAYRRILLTWLEDNGPYVFHSLNAHRVRITDSFTHYHPTNGGFDEFYLVQMANDSSRLLTSPRVADIEASESLSAEAASGLLDSMKLEVGDLVYLPRGTAHRGLGGVLAQVITVPGFRPGAEIGLDHHLRRLNERLDLDGEAALPFHEAASHEAVVR